MVFDVSRYYEIINIIKPIDIPITSVCKCLTGAVCVHMVRILRTPFAKFNYIIGCY